ncbi:dihydrofolate reductase family protein [Brevibacterium aurantiacum]|uniref:DNA-binding protein n=1 Tax=Brevibacterium aurantiacum TaxID=273384 RepID=A0A556CMU7_BREAU|nr:dihydrofolate reductase family protein [Brevibacterium aurantiacum]TSI18749.1 DNA-binding protein [Brevibacterium aurantiacum]
MVRVRVHSQFVSLDGYSAGDYVTFDEPIGGARALFGWFDGQGIEGIGGVDGPVTLDRALFAMWGQGIGAEIMGRKKFGPQEGPWPDDGWRGWWGEEPPFKTPCFILTHHPREAMEFSNGTSFHFVDDTPEAVLDQAIDAANGRDVRIGGGPSTIRQFLAADLIDFMAVAIVPITLGTGVSLWEGISGIEDRFTIETIGSSSGLTHQLWNRKDRG